MRPLSTPWMKKHFNALNSRYSSQAIFDVRLKSIFFFSLLWMVLHVAWLKNLRSLNHRGRGGARDYEKSPKFFVDLHLLPQNPPPPNVNLVDIYFWWFYNSFSRKKILISFWIYNRPWFFYVLIGYSGFSWVLCVLIGSLWELKRTHENILDEHRIKKDSNINLLFSHGFF